MGGIAMKESPTIDRIRESRRKISEEYGHDTEKLIKHYQEKEKHSKRKIFRKEIDEEKVA